MSRGTASESAEPWRATAMCAASCVRPWVGAGKYQLDLSHPGALVLVEHLQQLQRDVQAAVAAGSVEQGARGRCCAVVWELNGLAVSVRSWALMAANT